MFVFGHLGIGTWVGQRLWLRADFRTVRWLMAGTLLPDVIDKPLYYGLVLATGRRAADLGLISGTRTVGHTAALALVLWGLLRLGGAGGLGRALCLGLFSHWVIDLVGDPVGTALGRLGLATAPIGPPGPPTLAAVLFPLLGPHFPIAQSRSMAEHVSLITNAWTVGGEALGLVLLALLWRQGRLHRSWPGPVRSMHHR